MTMTFDISKYAQQIAQSAQAMMHRDNIAEGTHIIKLQSIDGISSKSNGNDYILIEGEVIESDSMPVNTQVKHFYQLSGCPVWKKEGNLKALKSFVCAVLPPEYANQVNNNVVMSAVTGGSSSALVPYLVRCRVVSKTSKNEKAFLETHWLHYANQSFDGSSSSNENNVPF